MRRVEVNVDEIKRYGRERVRLEEIVVDHNYQRDAATVAHVQQIAETWDERAANVVTLSLRIDGKYYVIDGQRRCAAARIAKGTNADIEAIVWIDLTPQEEATLFRQLQKRQQLTPLDVFKARLFEGEPVAVEIERIVTGLGLRIERGHGKGFGVVGAIAAVEHAYTTHGATGLYRALKLLRDGFAGEQRAFTNFSIGGMCLFLVRYATCSEARVIEVLKQRGPNGMTSRSAALRAALDTQTGMSSLWGQALRQEYNKGLRTQALVEWAARGYEARTEARRANG